MCTKKPTMILPTNGPHHMLSKNQEKHATETVFKNFTTSTDKFTTESTSPPAANLLLDNHKQETPKPPTKTNSLPTTNAKDHTPPKLNPTRKFQANLPLNQGPIAHHRTDTTDTPLTQVSPPVYNTNLPALCQTTRSVSRRATPIFQLGPTPNPFVWSPTMISKSNPSLPIFPLQFIPKSIRPPQLYLPLLATCIAKWWQILSSNLPLPMPYSINWANCYHLHSNVHHQAPQQKIFSNSSMIYLRLIFYPCLSPHQPVLQFTWRTTHKYTLHANHTGSHQNPRMTTHV